VTHFLINFIAGSVYGTYLFLPGFLILSCSGTFRNRFLLSIAISLTIIVLTLVPVYAFGGSILLWVGIFHLAVFGLAITTLTLYLRNSVTKFQRHRMPRISYRKSPLLGGLALLLIFTAYHASVGPYTEIPSDIWRHLARVGIELTALEDGYLGQRANLSLSILELGPVYVIHALVAEMLGVLPLELVPPVTLITSVIFLGSMYWFTLSLLGVFQLSANVRTFGGLLAAILTFATLGTATFSYVRYYAYFPAIFAFPLIYASTAIFLDYLQRPKNNGLQLFLVPIFLATMWLIHRQEALLSIILLSMIAFVRAIRSYLPGNNFATELKTRVRASAQVALSLIALILIYAYTTRTMNPWGNTPHVVDAGRFFSFLSGLPLDNPTFRFWDTLGYFGLGVYIWSLWYWRTLVRSDFLTAGMLLPLFTNLNPLYAALFLHFGPATGMWRTAYLIPLGIAAATLITVTLASKVATRHLLRRVVGYVLAAFLLLSLLPWHFNGYFNRTSRVPSLLKVEQESGAQLWQDLINKVNQIQNERQIRRIITDPATRFVLYAATRGQIWSWTEGEYFPNHNADYRRDFLESDFSHSLLVVNQRNGKKTQSALYAGHWPNDILEVSRFYPNELQIFIDSRPDLFQLLWHKNQIRIYLMHPSSS